MIFGRKNSLVGLFLSAALLGPWTSAWSQGKFVYVTEEERQGQRSDRVAAFTIDETTGALTQVPGSPFLAGGISPLSVTVDPSGQFVYVANNLDRSDGNSVSAFTIDETTGALTPVSGSPFSVLPGRSPASVTVDPSGQFVYVINIDSNDVSAFTIDKTTGALTPVLGSPFSLFPTTRPPSRTSLYPQPMMVVDPSGHFLYVTNNTDPAAGALPGSNDVSAFTINATTGALTPVPGSPFPTGRSPGPAAVHPSGHFLYVWNTMDPVIPTNVSVYTIDARTGGLTQIAGSPFFGEPSRVNGVAMHPSGQFMYVTDGGIGSVSEYSIDQTTGAPTRVGDFRSPPQGSAVESGVAVDSSGHFLYAATIRGGTVAFTIDQTTGALTPVPGSPFAADARTFSVSVAIASRCATPPTLSLSLSPTVLWPPNHKLVQITANIQVSDICDPNPTVKLLSITSNEALQPGDVQAAIGTDARSFQLRATRAGSGTGRVYAVTYQATDHSGNSTTASATVTVPHDQGNH